MSTGNNDICTTMIITSASIFGALYSLLLVIIFCMYCKYRKEVAAMKQASESDEANHNDQDEWRLVNKLMGQMNDLQSGALQPAPF